MVVLEERKGGGWFVVYGVGCVRSLSATVSAPYRNRGARRGKIFIFRTSPAHLWVLLAPLGGQCLCERECRTVLWVRDQPNDTLLRAQMI